MDYFNLITNRRLRIREYRLRQPLSELWRKATKAARRLPRATQEYLDLEERMAYPSMDAAQKAALVKFPSYTRRLLKGSIVS